MQFRLMRSYSPGALATIALWKSAPMITGNFRGWLMGPNSLWS